MSEDCLCGHAAHVDHACAGCDCRYHKTLAAQSAVAGRAWAEFKGEVIRFREDHPVRFYLVVVLLALIFVALYHLAPG